MMSRPVPGGFAYFDYDNHGLMDAYLVDSERISIRSGTGHSGVGFSRKPTGVNFRSKPATGKVSSSLNTLLTSLLGGSSGSSETFVRIGHSLMALIVAFAGGHISRHIEARSAQRLLRRDPDPE